MVILGKIVGFSLKATCQITHLVPDQGGSFQEERDSLKRWKINIHNWLKMMFI